MPDRVHLACAGGREWVAAIFAEARRHYTAAISIGSDGRAICSRVRFGAVVMDEPHLWAAARYIALNPVVAGLVSRAED